MSRNPEFFKGGLLEADPDTPKKRQGCFRKYSRIERADGQSAPGGKHEHCEYWVLDLSCDPFAYPALHAYALACVNTYPQLSTELIVRLKQAGYNPPSWTQIDLPSESDQEGGDV